MKVLSYPVFSFLLYAGITCHGQSQQVAPAFFQTELPISIQLTISIKEVAKSRIDTVYFPSVLKYKNEKDTWDSIAIGVRARGNFRRNHCLFPPMRLKLKKSLAEGTPFDGNKNFKLVLPCNGGKSGNNLIVKEYLCYKLLEPITPYFLHTRLANTTLNDQHGKNIKSYSLIGFLIEDDDLVAHRFGGKVMDSLVPQIQMNDTAVVIHDFFEYMIANTDWSTNGQHNTKVIQLPQQKYVPLPYDFDMAGLVNAPYATVNETLGIKSVTERLYRGYCRKEAIMEYVRSKYQQLKPAIMKVMENHQSYFNEGEYAQLKNFISEFFDILNSDKQFSDAILSGCRTN